MHILIVVCGAVGAWLLVAGPVYQAALELREQEVDRELMERVQTTVAAPARMSPWWWLLPPVAYLKQRRLSREHRQAMFQAMPAEQIEQMVTFIDKASGWLLVAGGAALIAVKETYELTELLDWPLWLFFVLIVVTALVCVGNAAYRMVRSEHLMQHDRAAAAKNAAGENSAHKGGRGRGRP